MPARGFRAALSAYILTMNDFAWHIPDPETMPEFYADVPVKRLVAWGVDTVLILIISLVIVPFTAFTAIFFFPMLFLTVSIIYRVATLAGGSATFGMRLMAIEFRLTNGRRFDLAHAFFHTLGYSLCLCFLLPQVLSVVLMLNTARGQGLPDHVLGTVALNRRAADL